MTSRINIINKIKTKSYKDMVDNYDTIIIFTCKLELSNIEKLLGIKFPGSSHKDLVRNEFKGKKGEKFNFYYKDTNIILMGINSLRHNNCKNIYAHEVSGMIGKQIYNTDKTYLIIFNNDLSIENQISGLMLGLYRFTKYNKEPIKNPKVDIYVNKIKDDYKNEIIISDNQNEIRELINEPVNILDSTAYVKYIKKSLSKYKNIKVKVFDEKKLKKLGMNLILAVNKGCNNPPYLVVIEYNYNNNNASRSNDNNICLVGKGVMFDTGGLNLKVKEIKDMKIDMAGSATVYGVIKTLADLKVKKTIIGILPIVQNAVGSYAAHPGDIVKSYSGKTVEIIDTDAEGRLILADALYYCKKYNPKLIIDIATLTGNAAHVFGNLATAIMGNDIARNAGIINDIIKTGNEENEKIWELPIYEEYIDLTKSKIADLNNLPKSTAGASIAGAFLLNFLPNDKVNWIHLDTAGPAYLSVENKMKYEGATGEPFRTIIKYLINQ
jgi:leucyl aminopeptidase